ncbi:hypothetical protein BP5796_07765 [Coleophoma crateriformis]|uniref:L-lactate dehydrogenase (cytochrome) n=1 Tax=Coleophoma crateriformis TaxID=565419 RepID=A0A3D8RCW3_9HELO|nr:hypothetical protein BP5796_07765 [Coleophoma crateriformis]
MADSSEEDIETEMQALLNLDEIEAVATKKISHRAWAYYYSAGDDLISKKLNSQVYKAILLRPRVFIDCTKCDTRTTLLGHQLGTPLYVSPAAMARLGHPAGERGIAQGIASFGALQVISNFASMTPAQIVTGAAPGQKFGWQLYVSQKRATSEKMLATINAMGDRMVCVCLTLDSPVLGKREDHFRLDVDLQKPAVAPGWMAPGGTALDLTWRDTLAWLARHTTLPIILKGIQTHEDAYLAMQCAPQVRGIILSNHGGRSLDTAPPAVHTLLEIRKYCPEVFERIEVWVDGGIKRGTDVVKALCLGAKAVGIGRAALFGLGAGGPQGVERTFEILQAEIETCMRLLGVEKISELGPQYINSKAVEMDIFDGQEGKEELRSWAKANL